MAFAQWTYRGVFTFHVLRGHSSSLPSSRCPSSVCVAVVHLGKIEELEGQGVISRGIGRAHFGLRWASMLYYGALRIRGAQLDMRDERDCLRCVLQRRSGVPRFVENE
jgi:hypothetical protein